jgi:oxygen-independent coproporphyrinogen-3 oxidase
MDDSIEPFVQALLAELRYIARVKPQIPLKTVFFGGGTPSMLSIAQLALILDTIRRDFALVPHAEISLEANPNDLNRVYLQGLVSVGVNRLSLGMQSADERELAMYGRQHTSEMVAQAVQDAHAVGLTNISLDLIFGNPHQTLQQWERTLQQALRYLPTHISLYGLEVKGGTVLKAQITRGDLPSPDDDLAADMYQLAESVLEDAGLQHYEISNWAKMGYEAQHNLQYWHNLPYLGVGAGAHGYVDNVRTIVTRLPQRYIHAMQYATQSQRAFPRTPATSKAVPVTRESEMVETLMTGLRLTREGISREGFKARFGVDIVAERATSLSRLVSLGMVEVTETAVRLTKAGRFISNRVISELL